MGALSCIVGADIFTIPYIGFAEGHVNEPYFIHTHTGG